MSCAATGRRRGVLCGVTELTYLHNDLQHSRFACCLVGEGAIWPVNKVAWHTFLWICMLASMALGKHASDSLNISLACVYRPKRGEWCAEIDSAHPRRQLKLRKYNRCRRVDRAGYTARRLPVVRVHARQPKNLLDRPHKPLLLFLSILVRAQFRKLARNGNSAEALLTCERIRRPVVAPAVYPRGIRRHRAGDITFVPHVLQHLFRTSFG